MAGFVKFHTFFRGIHSNSLRTLTPVVLISKNCHFGTNPGHRFSNQSSNLNKDFFLKNVAVFWDLDNKPPISVSPFDAAVRLKEAAALFGVVRYMVAYANRYSLSYVPPEISEKRKDMRALIQLENRGVLKPDNPYVCLVCGRKFYNYEKLMNHFRQIHEREHAKRLSQIESARGSKRVKLVGKYSMKMEKYRNAARDVLTPKVGYGLGEELERAGFWVRTVSDKPQAADIALKDHMVDVMDKRIAECVILVSDDSDFVEVLEEAKLRCLKTVVVGNINYGALKRVSDVALSWKEIILGKPIKEAVSAVGRWKDSDALKKLEWACKPEGDRKMYGSNGEDDDENEDSNFEGFFSGEDENDGDVKDDTTPWWKLESDTDTTISK